MVLWPSKEYGRVRADREEAFKVARWVTGHLLRGVWGDLGLAHDIV